ncbi:DUF3046 domain-containing protein [Kineosporia babensis]|uniref:DUF3046 domain-containing protein n=1 Tax=Kineosporia babensis TaxID=499548 RepID=A0A9X1T1Q8_9ACTN|nr:DUF3046 domain-containing protein [Kineosporia babensis]
MRSSEFWDLVDEEFGRAHGRTLVRDHVLLELGNRTAEQAIEAGEPLREVWFALCDSMDVPAHRRWGQDEKERRRA